uniref:Ribonuclease H n=1 Tax=Lygus hesperus TaxID=30085 RepID=A0A0A9ZJ93_LYGHE
MQNAALRQITGAVKTTPIPSLHSLTSTIYISTRFQFETERNIARLLIYSPHLREEATTFINPPYRRTSKGWNKYRLTLSQTIASLEEHEVHLYTDREIRFRITAPSQLPIFTKIPTIEKKDNLSPLELKQRVLEHLQLKFPTFPRRVFTDGSKLENGNAGSGIFCELHNYGSGTRLHKTSSIFHAELTAIYMAVEHILRTPSQTPMDTIILSDSQSSLEFLKNFKIGDNPPYLVQQILLMVDDIKKKNNVKIAIQWIPSHINLTQADHADVTAKAYAEHGAQNLHSTVPFSDLVKHIKIQRDISWRTEHYRRLIGRGAWTNHIIPDPLNKPWYRGVVESTTFFTVTNRILFGHGNTPLFQYLMRHRDDPFCPHCPDSH